MCVFVAGMYMSTRLCVCIMQECVNSECARKKEIPGMPGGGSLQRLSVCVCMYVCMKI